MNKYLLLVALFSSGKALGFECKTENLKPTLVPSCKITIVDHGYPQKSEEIEHPLRGDFFKHCPGVARSHNIGDRLVYSRSLEARFITECNDACGNRYPFRFKAFQDFHEKQKSNKFGSVVPLRDMTLPDFFKYVRARCPNEQETNYDHVENEINSVQDYILYEVPPRSWTHELWPFTPLVQEEKIMDGATAFKYRDQGNSLLVEIKYTSEAAVYFLKAVLTNEVFSQLRYPIEMGPGLKKKLSVSVGNMWLLDEDQSFAAQTSVGFQLIKNELVLKEDEIELMSKVIKKLEKMGSLVWDQVLFAGKQIPVAFNGSGELFGIQILVPLKTGVGFEILDLIVAKDGNKLQFKEISELPRKYQVGGR